jgi:hypothetical protein
LVQNQRERKIKMKTMIALLGLTLGGFGQIGCEPRNESTAAPRTEPEALNLPPTAAERFHLQSECVEMGEKVLENNLAYQMEKLDMEQGKVPKDDVTQLAHYNAKDNHCYVELSLHDTGEHMKYAMREVYDGQTGELLASYTIKNPPVGEASGIIFKYDRVPASALPAPLGFSKEHSDKDRRENDAERTEAYINYLMEGN